MVYSLIIVKLPFAVPDPISEAEKETYDSLETYIQSIIVPDMQKKLRQGFGRAIRTETDTCVVFYFRYSGGKRRQVSRRCDVCASVLPDSRRVERGTGFHPQPERCRVLFVIGKILFPALLLVLIFQTLLGEKFSTVFGAVLERLLVLMNSYLNMKWV